MLDFIIIGAQKAGSTFVQQCLQDHPEIYLPRGETPFFEDPDYNPKSLDTLAAAVRRARIGQIRGIKRPDYLGWPQIPERISRHFPDVKLVAVLREPVSRAVSAYFHYMRSGLLPIEPIDVGLPKVLSGALAKRWPRAWQIVEFGMYSKHLNGYFRYFNRQRVKVVVLDDVRSNPVGVMRDIYDFLGVDKSFMPRRIEQRPMAVFYSLERLRFHRIISPLMVEREENTGRIFPRRGIVPKYALKPIFAGVDRWVLAKIFPVQRPSLPLDLAEQLRQIYEADVSTLRELLSHPLSNW